MHLPNFNPKRVANISKVIMVAKSFLLRLLPLLISKTLFQVLSSITNSNKKGRFISMHLINLNPFYANLSKSYYGCKKNFRSGCSPYKYLKHCFRKLSSISNGNKIKTGF